MIVDQILDGLAEVAVLILAAIGAWYVVIGRDRWERELDALEKRLHRAERDRYPHRTLRELHESDED